MKYIYAPITLTNSQSQASPSNFQQLIQVPTPQYFNGVRFWSPTDGWLHAWLESIQSNSANIWVKIPSSIPANGTYQLYMIQDSNLPMDGVYWGEAPQLSSTYAQYDNGASVFNNYWNFAGTSTPSGINVYTDLGSVTFNNGVTIKGGTSATGGENGIATSDSFSAPIVFDYYGTQSTNPPNYAWAWNYAGFSNYLSSSYLYPAYGGTYTSLDFDHGLFADVYQSQGGTITYGSLSSPANNLFPPSVWSQIYTLSSYYTYQNYNSANNTGYVTGASNTASLPFLIMVGNNEASLVPNGMTVYWLRTRAYPPNGVMPTVSLGASQYSGELITVAVP